MGLALINGSGRKWTHLGTMFLILRVRVENGLHLHELEWRLSRRAFRRRRQLTFPAGCSRRKQRDLQLNELEVVGSSERVCRSHLTVDDEGTVTTNGVSYDVL